MNEILAVFLPCHHLVCNWFSVICFYFEQGGWQRVAGFSAHQSLLVLFALIIFTAADLAALLSSFSADTACQHGASLAGDSSPLFGSGSREVTIPSTTLLSPPPSSPARLGACCPASLRQLHWGLQDQLPCEPSWGFRALTLLDFICEWAFDLRNE